MVQWRRGKQAFHQTTRGCKEMYFPCVTVLVFATLSYFWVHFKNFLIFRGIFFVLSSLRSFLDISVIIWTRWDILEIVALSFVQALYRIWKWKKCLFKHYHNIVLKASVASTSVRPLLPNLQMTKRLIWTSESCCKLRNLFCKSTIDSLQVSYLHEMFILSFSVLVFDSMPHFVFYIYHFCLCQ